MTEINAPVDAREGLRVKPKNQREVLETLLMLYREGKLPKDRTLPVYDLLLKQNLVAWEEDFAEFMQEYRRTKNAEALLSSVDSLIGHYKIEPRGPAGIRKLERNDLEVIGYVFLSKPLGEFPLLVDTSGTAEEPELGGQTKFVEGGKLGGNSSLGKWAKTP
jgi:hypothetical protein